MIMTLNTAVDCSLDLDNKVMIDFVKEMMDVLFNDNEFLHNVSVLARDTIVVNTTDEDNTSEKRQKSFIQDTK